MAEKEKSADSGEHGENRPGRPPENKPPEYPKEETADALAEKSNNMADDYHHQMQLKRCEVDMKRAKMPDDDDDDEFPAKKPKREEDFTIKTVAEEVDYVILRRQTPKERDGFFDKDTHDPDLENPHLSAEEENRLAKLEEIVRKGDYYFLQGGLALLKIWESKLYRKYERFFYHYLKGRFEFSRVRAYQLIAAADVYAYLLERFDKKQLSQKVAPYFALTEVPVERFTEVYQHALDGMKTGKKPTVHQIKESIKALGLGKKKPDDSENPNEDPNEKKHSPAFKEFKQNIDRIKSNIGAMQLTAINLVFNGPFWRLDVAELTEAKAMLEGLTKSIADTIASAKKNAVDNEKQEFSMLMTKAQVKKRKLLNNPHYTVEEEGLGPMIVTRRKLADVKRTLAAMKRSAAKK